MRKWKTENIKGYRKAQVGKQKRVFHYTQAPETSSHLDLKAPMCRVALQRVTNVATTNSNKPYKLHDFCQLITYNEKNKITT
ncbi:hypothetical protein E2C01_063788 [Portunus trituberculatus]|uniref:Uncharacterized protein n=1 Tax=Portunus trituberculatus TaxID=210409 RepID=A0A5B7HBF2_PORTR|nr:hypothetical protein [Portunus trituberculatus]